jgi:integrase/recombinase XerD
MGAARALSCEEHEALKGGFTGQWRERNRCLWVFLYRTGFRITEALSLNVKDIIREDGRMVADVTVQKKFMKRKLKSRTVPLHRELKAELASWLRWLEGRGLNHGDAPLFPAGNSRRLTRQEAWLVIKTAGRRAHVETSGLSTHSGRKSLGYHSLNFYEDLRIHGERVEPLLMVKEVLGHESLNSTQKYLPTNQDKIKDCFLNLN